MMAIAWQSVFGTALYNHKGASTVLYSATTLYFDCFIFTRGAEYFRENKIKI